MSNKRGLANFIIFSNHQKVLSFLARFSDKEFYEREIARKIGISSGSANKVLNDLYRDGLLERRQRGKMYFYRFNQADPIFRQFKILNCIALLRPVINKLRNTTRKIVLYGSCATGTNTSESDIDLFIISDNRKKVLKIIHGFSFRIGFEEFKIEPVILSPQEFIKSEKIDQEFLSLVREGIVLWDKMAHEPGIEEMPGK